MWLCIVTHAIGGKVIHVEKCDNELEASQFALVWNLRVLEDMAHLVETGEKTHRVGTIAWKHRLDVENKAPEPSMN